MFYNIIKQRKFLKSVTFSPLFLAICYIFTTFATLLMMIDSEFISTSSLISTGQRVQADHIFEANKTTSETYLPTQRDFSLRTTGTGSFVVMSRGDLVMTTERFDEELSTSLGMRQPMRAGRNPGGAIGELTPIGDVLLPMLAFAVAYLFARKRQKPI